MAGYLGFNDSLLRDIGGEHTAKEICQQPRVWRDVIEIINHQKHQLDTFLSPLVAKKNLRIILSGAGTSAFAGKVVAPHLARVNCRRFEAVSTTDIVAAPQEYFYEQVPTLLVSIARSGNSPESVATVKLAEQCLTECYHLILTCNPEGDLAAIGDDNENIFCLVMPEGTHDKGFAMTSSFTSMMLSVLCIFNPNQDSTEIVKSLSCVTEKLLKNKSSDIKALANKGFERVVFLGSSSLQGLAQEASLKLLELSAGRVLSVFDSPLGFRHGPKAIVNDKTAIIAFISNDQYTRQYDFDLLTELQRDNKAAYILSLLDMQKGERVAGNSIDLGETMGLESVWLSFPFIVIAQVFAFYTSINLHITPDNPFPSGEVNRVVQDVIIHSFNS